MEGGALFNSGFLGASFNWWIGQVAPDSTWRDNISPGKIESPKEIPGWGYRYKVRIIGLHDQGETEIASDQLPWAQVMYPVTAGGGQASSGQTPNIRQGNMVFGFFLDGQEQQVPVIMGVLGNNAQTALATKIGDNKVTNAQAGSIAVSGYAEPAVGTKDPNIKAPDQGLAITKPGVDPSPAAVAVPGATIETTTSVHGQSAMDQKMDDLLKKKVVMLSPCDLPGSVMKGMQTEIGNLTTAIDKVLKAKQSYLDAVSQVKSLSSGGGLLNQISGISGSLGQLGGVTGQIGGALGQVSGIVGQVQGIAGQVGSIAGGGGGIAGALGQVQGIAGALGQVQGIAGALGQVQGIAGQIGGVTNQISGALGQVQGIAGGISGIAGGISGIGDIPGALGGIGDLLGQVDDTEEKIEALMEKFAPKLAKNMKVVMNKIGEFTSKTINKIIGPLGDLQFPNMRFEFLNMKLKINEKLKCLFSKLANGLGKKILDALKNLFGKKKSKPSANPSSTSPTGTAPLVPMCSVEQLTGEILGSSMGDINKAAEEITQSVGTFMQDSQSGLPVVGKIGNIAGQVGGIAGKVGAAADKVAGIAGAVGGIAGQVGGIAGAVGGIAGQIGGLGGQIGGLLGGFGNLKLGDIKFPDIGKSIKAALSFENITLNLFGCDSKPNCPATDAFTLQSGGEAVPDANKSEVAKNASAPNDLDDLDRATTDADRAEANRSQQELQNRSYDRPGVTVTSSATSYAN
jgi:methyl-accepting chemotaxis protein